MFEIDNIKFKKIRKEAKLSQEAVATTIGKNKKDVSHYENGRAKPPADSLLTFLIEFKVDPLDIAKKV